MRAFVACVIGIHQRKWGYSLGIRTTDFIRLSFVRKLTLAIHALFRVVFFCGSEMVALWALADVALVTSLREGVNLGAMEFVACQQTSMHGVLVYR